MDDAVNAVPKKAVKDMTEQERKAYNTRKKKESRERQKKKQQQEIHAAVEADRAERAYEVPDEPELEPDKKRLFEAHSDSVRQQIESEIGRGLNEHDKEWEVVCGLSQVSFGLEKNLVLLSFNPHGVRLNYWFPEVALANAIEFTRKNPRSPIVYSPTFKAVFQKALDQSRNYFSKNRGAADPGWVDILREAA